MTSRARRGAAVLAAALLLTACEGGDPGATSSPTASLAPSASAAEACAGVVDDVVAVAQRYVDQYDAAAATRRPEGQPPDIRQELERARERLESLGCAPGDLAERLTDGLDSLEADGPLAEAVKGQLVAAMTGRVASVATTRRVGTDDDLRDVLPELAPGSTVHLAAGEHRLTGPVVLLQGVRLVGDGRGRTTVTSSAPEAAVLALAQGRVDLRRLTLRHVGDEPASVVVSGAATSLVLDEVAVVGGSAGSADDGRRAAQGQGGSGVVMASGRDAGQGERTTLQVTDSVFRGNEAAGILVSDGHVASVVGSRFLDSGQCGICFVGNSSGLVRDSVLQGGAAGLIAADRAAPLLAASTVRGVEIGVQAVGRASPVVRRSTVVGTSRAAFFFGERSRGRVESVTCRQNEVGIAVGPDALPFIGDTTCQVRPTG